MIDYEKELNREQYRVVTEEGGPLLVLAGAGSGKTRTLTYRVARLLESGIQQENILLATFTNKAARSMLNRVESLINSDTRNIMGGTFHHVAHLVLRKHAHYLGYKTNFSIVDSEDSRQIISTCMGELKIDPKLSKFPKSNILAEIISLTVNTQNTLDDVLESRYPFFLHLINEINQIACLYEQKKKELVVMDFDDLLNNCRTLLKENPDILKTLSGRFEHILVDEYQDTNIIQADIVDLLASCHRNLMVVGDDSQSIYSFRGANFNNIINFPHRYPDCKIFKLETNYRSTPEILNLANLSITNNEKQFPKELKAVRDSGMRPVMVSARNVVKQADFVAQRVTELIRSGVPLKEIAVLYRAHYHSMEMQMEFVRRDIPFDMRSGIRFFEQAHIKDVTSYMRILVNPRDELAWRRLLIMYPKVGKVTFNKIWQYLKKEENPLKAVLKDEFIKTMSKSAKPGLEECRKTIMLLLELPEKERIPEKVIDVLLNRGGYRVYLQDNYSDASSREEDLIQLGNFSAQFIQMEDFLNELALLTNMAKEENVSEEDDEDKIALSTIHQAKGLEWAYVFLIWCADGMIPLQRALKEQYGEEEERRLFYVAVTRAKDQLYLCYPALDYTRSSGVLNLAPSRFIREIAPLSEYDEDRPFEQWLLYD
ncbi:MAG: UvrD-helicase domain-containing protein [Smithella sp.]|jgi:DNA helicase-2/ATP-dependent DNA helicase PcrA|nr:UvrD-helicase domain-containing protein [Smithella sp.]MDD5525552.1 UvrD-helicase domain-containing protein [Smithella sp.]